MTASQQPHQPSTLPQLEEFIRAVEAKTTNTIHLRILGACRSENPKASMEAELTSIIEDILHED